MTEKPVAFFAIVNKGFGNKVLKVAKEGGTSGGTIIRCEGTVANRFLNLMGLDETKKELMVTLVPKAYEEKLHQLVSEKLHLDKSGMGIVFSANTSSVYGSRLNNHDFEESDENMKNYQLMVTIVDRDSGDDVVEAARKAGAKGATILHGRGTGTAEISKVFNIEMQPEKELVLLVVEGERVTPIADVIRSEMKLDLPGNGVIFSMPLNEVTGLVQDL